MRSRRIGFTIGLLAAAGCDSPTAPATTSTARIVGTVTASISAAQAGVTVNARQDGAPAPRSASTDSTGHYAFDDMVPGLWRITLEPRTLAAGILTPHSLDVAVNAGQQADASFALTEVVVSGTFLGSATAQATGAITDTLATLGHPFFPSGPYALSIVLTPLGGRAFHAQ